MALPFVEAKYYTRGGRDPLRTYAPVAHMAQGGGTVGYLSKSGGVSNNNSSTLVVDYDGDVTQMVRVRDMDHSLHVSYDPDDRDAPDFGLYSLAIAAAVLKPAGLGSLQNLENVLPFVVSIEYEGFAGTPPARGQRGYDPRANPKGGPNAKQLEATRLVVVPWLRMNFPNLRGALGHRDFQDYKPCPGGSAAIRELFAIFGGHGVWHASTPTPTPKPTEANVPTLSSYIPGYAATIKPTANVRSDAKLTASILRVVSAAESWVVTGWVKGDVDPDGGSDQWLVRWANGRWEYTAKSNATSGPTAPAGDCAAAVSAATAPLKSQISTQAASIATLETKLTTAASAERDRLADKEAARIRAL